MGINEERELLYKKISLCLSRTQELQSIASQLLDYNPYELAEVMGEIIDNCEHGRTAFEKAATQAEKLLSLLGWGNPGAGVSASSSSFSSNFDLTRLPDKNAIEVGVLMSITHQNEAEFLEQVYKLESDLEISIDNNYNLLKFAQTWLKKSVKTIKHPKIAMMVFSSICHLASGAGGAILAQTIPALNKARSFNIVNASYQVSDRLDKLKDGVEFLQKSLPPIPDEKTNDMSELCSAELPQFQPDYSYNDAYKLAFEENLKRREEELKRRKKPKS
jgi:hypothetical protein